MLWATAHYSDASVKTRSPPVKTRLRPKRSAIDPDVSTTAASASV